MRAKGDEFPEPGPQCRDLLPWSRELRSPGRCSAPGAFSGGQLGLAGAGQPAQLPRGSGLRRGRCAQSCPGTRMETLGGLQPWRSGQKRREMKIKKEETTSKVGGHSHQDSQGFWRRSFIKYNTCCCLVAQLCPTLRDPMDRSTPGLPVHHQLPEFTQIHVH